MTIVQHPCGAAHAACLVACYAIEKGASCYNRTAWRATDPLKPSSRAQSARSTHHMKSNSPDPSDIFFQREICRLTQKEAAEIIGVTPRSWIRYEKGDRRMMPGLWKYFRAVVKARRKREQEALMNATTPEREALTASLLAYATRRSPEPVIEWGGLSQHIVAQRPS